MLKDPFIYIAWLAVVALALLLRTQQLDQRPLHADEATGARILAKQLEGDDYRFDPQHFHGPVLTQMTRPFAAIRGEKTWEQLSVQTLRSSTTIAGILLIFTPLLWLRPLGQWGAWGAAALLATSPVLVYYSRMYIHESWLALFGMLACAGVYHLAHKPTAVRAMATGLAIGWMFATKETFVISILSWAPATLLLLWMLRRDARLDAHSCELRAYLKAAAILGAVALVSAGIFYSDCLRQPAQFIDAFRTFFEYQTTAGHQKSFSYYLQLLVWPKQAAKLWWTEGFVVILAVSALLISRKSKRAGRAGLFLSVAAVLHLLIYSVIGYKTPWLMLLPWAHTCLLAGYAVQAVSLQPRWIRLACIPLLVIGLAYQTKQSLLAGGRLANSPHNPYAYVPTSADCEKIAKWLHALDAKHPLGALAVVGKEYWPLPWYLRNIGTDIGYWPEPVDDLATLSVVFAMPAQNNAVRQQLQSSHTELPRSLRVNVPVILYLRNDLWRQWQQSNGDE